MKLLIAILGLALLPIEPSTLQAQSGTIHVSVRVPGSAVPVPNVQVTLAPGSNATAITDSKGDAVFTNLPSGSRPGTIYTVSAERDGYVTQPGQSRKSVILSDRDPSQDVVLSLAPESFVSGRVRDANGMPLAGVAVSAGTVGVVDGRRYFSSPLSTARTDSTGSYRMTGLPIGDFFVRVEPRSATSSGVVTYYPGVLDINAATRISIAVGGVEVVSIDFDVPVFKNFKISGRVADPQKLVPSGGQAISPELLFALVPRSAGTVNVPTPMTFRNQRSGSTGEFEILGVPVGSWDLIAEILLPSAGGRNSAAPRYAIGRISLDLVDRDVDDVRITLSSVEIRGRLSGDWTSAAHVILLPADNTPAAFVSHLRSPQGVDASGAFSFPSVPPGKYRLQLQSINGLYVADIRLGSSSIYDSGVFEVGTMAAEPLEINLKAAHGYIEGFVEGIPSNASPEDLRNIRVVLVPNNPRRQNLLLYQTATVSRADGLFGFFFAPPGEYKIFAWKDVPVTTAESPDFVSKYEGMGVPVTAIDGPIPFDVKVPLISDTK